MTPSILRVVIADDTEDVRVLLSHRLKLEGGFDVVAEAETGAEAITAVERFDPDVIVLDLAMPVMDGMEAIPEIKKLRPDIKIVVLSGFEEELLAKQALEKGADTYLEKGLAMQDLGLQITRLFTADRVL